MHPLSSWPCAERRPLVGVFTDIDDALQALAQLQAAGLTVIAITGRPVGWSEPFAACWPVDAIVAENGSIALIPGYFMDENGLQPPSLLRESLSKLYQQDDATRAIHCARMQLVAQRVLREMPGTTLAQDSPGRETDIAIDHSEFTHLPPDRIAQVGHILRSEGVANIRRFEAERTHPARYLTQGERGAGCAEVAHAILEARRT